MAYDKAIDSAAVEAVLTGACNAIREKGGASGPIDFDTQLASSIRAIPGPKPEQSKTVTITANGDFPIKPDPGNVLSEVLAKVAVPGSDVSPYSKIEVRTWVGDGSSKYMYGIEPASGTVLDIAMFKLPDGTGSAIDANLVIVRDGSGVEPSTGAVYVEASTSRDASKGAEAYNGTVNLLSSWGRTAIKFFEGVEYFVIIGTLDTSGLWG